MSSPKFPSSPTDKRLKRYSKTTKPPPFSGPPTRRQSYTLASQFATLDEASNALIGQCVEWRRQYQSHTPSKKKSSSSRELTKLEDDRELLIATANAQAISLSRRQGARLAIELAEAVKPQLFLPGYVPSPEAKRFASAFERPSGTVREQVQMLKKVRYELALAMIVERFVHVDELGMVNEHRWVYERVDQLTYCALAQEHVERTKERRGYRIDFLAEKDASDFVDQLNRKWENAEAPRAVSGMEEAALVRAFRGRVSRQIPLLTVQAQLAEEGRYQNAAMLLMTKAAIVESAGNLLNLVEPRMVARDIIEDFLAKQSVVTSAAVRGAAQREIEQHLTTQVEDREIWPEDLMVAGSV